MFIFGLLFWAGPRVDIEKIDSVFTIARACASQRWEDHSLIEAKLRSLQKVYDRGPLNHGNWCFIIVNISFNFDCCYEPF